MLISEEDRATFQNVVHIYFQRMDNLLTYLLT